MKSGWIKFYRKTFEKERTLEEVGFWAWLLCAAEYDGEYRGKFLTTITAISEYWHVTRDKIKWILAKWVDEGQIQTETIGRSAINLKACSPPSPFSANNTRYKPPHGIIISILNYEIYQGDEISNTHKNTHTSGNSYKKNKNKNPSAITPSESKGTKSKKNKTKAHPRYQEVVDHFHQEFDQRYGYKYYGQKKDYAAISRMLKKIDADDLKQRISEYLADGEPFLVKNGHPMSLLQSRINSYGRPNFGKSATTGSGYLERTY